ncbi:adenylate/guanylate cyclase domain-containing protein [Trichothermofontia sichuanensis B231]|uniref:CHASE2 domain-containing protein n=1 Tax=Trichothermofontia sichuanensis TaxID=3045816 RepID=UPI0022475836|nr:adenylate/guanylate cyclase domain-containing protein [Trichothermofontia sichuanensis]UZQ52778.1 adenylate/guanylate cyclase domain-containing protein [Trichothermofontia sichuanensis B231]
MASWVSGLEEAGRSMRQYLKTAHPLLIGGIVGLFAIALWRLGIWQPLEYLAYNQTVVLRQRLFRPVWSQEVVVIAIDEASLQQYGQFPWPRRRYTDLLQKLAVSQPAAIGFDILFAEPTADDAAFAEAIAYSGNVVLAVGGDFEGNPIAIVPELAQVAHQGHIYNRADADAITRQFALYLGTYPSLGIALLQVYQQSLQNTVTLAHPDGNLSPTDLPVIPLPLATSNDRWLWVNWIGPTSGITTYSFAAVVSGRVSPRAFSNKIVLVGPTATGIDSLYTPFHHSPPTSGVYLHAAVIDNLLQQRELRRVEGFGVDLGLLAIALLLAWGCRQQTPRWRLGLVLAAISGIWLGTFLLFAGANFWLPMAAPIGTITLTWIGLQLWEQYERQWLFSIFSKYISPEMTDLIWERRSELFQSGQVQAQEMVVTVLFLDIRGFTSIAENIAPRLLLDWLNAYLEMMTDCIMDHGGMVDKYIGDAVMAVFGVPFPHTQAVEIQRDARQAIEAAITIHERLKPLNQKFEKQGKPQIKVGIGIHTGLVVAGSLGGGRRLNYSVLGDTVNIAARLEAMNKEVTVGNPYNILVTGETLTCVYDYYIARPVNNFQLRGREQRTLVFAILGRRHLNQSQGAKPQT